MELKPSPEFTAFAARGAMKDREWMPCPKCGGEKTVYLSRAARIGGGITAAFIFAGLAIVSIFLVPFLVFIFLGLAVIVPVGMIAMSSGKPYQCDRCHFRWTFDEATKWARQGNPTEPTSPQS
jgi:hypothetical protein